jgi:hypothetical protein
MMSSSPRPLRRGLGPGRAGDAGAPPVVGPTVRLEVVMPLTPVDYVGLVLLLLVALTLGALIVVGQVGARR